MTNLPKWIGRFANAPSEDIASAVAFCLIKNAPEPIGRETIHTQTASVLRDYWLAARAKETTAKEKVKTDKRKKRKKL